MRGFTLVEVLVSVLIVAIVSAGGYVAFFVVSQTNQADRNLLYAVTLSQLTLEEIRTNARNNFDALENIKFPDIDQAKYSGFHRFISINKEGSTEFKRAEVVITWKEKGVARDHRLALLLARPPDPLPANIHGNVTNAKTGAVISGVSITITYAAGSNITASTTTDTNGNYTFLDNAGNPRLKTGSWNLVAKRSGFYASPVISVSNLSPNEDREVNLALEPKPEPARISGRVVDATTGGLLPVKAYVGLFQNGSNLSWTLNNPFSFTVTFDNTDPKKFTIATWEYNYSYFPPFYCGQLPDSHGWGKQYNYLGWSTSAVQDDGTFVKNPWYGSSATDRIVVNPGDNLDIGDIPLALVPRATIRGYVRTSDGQPVAGKVYMIWHNGHWITSSQGEGTNKDGSFDISVPAEQELFPDSPFYYLYSKATGPSLVTGSCGITTQVNADTGWRRIGPLYTGQIKGYDFTLPLPSEGLYGNATGYVYDGKTTRPVHGAKVDIWTSKTTDTTGQYEFKCAPSQAGYYMIPVNSYTVTVSRTDYYDFSSGGNNYYSSRSPIVISANKTAPYENIYLWPKGKGEIGGRVLIAASADPIKGAKVELRYYSHSAVDKTSTTNGNGEFEFKDVVESWPPPGIVGNTYYKQLQMGHSLTVSYTSEYEPQTISNIVLDDGEDKDLGDIRLRIKGQM